MYEEKIELIDEMKERGVKLTLRADSEAYVKLFDYFLAGVKTDEMEVIWEHPNNTTLAYAYVKISKDELSLELRLIFNKTNKTNNTSSEFEFEPYPAKDTEVRYVFYTGIDNVYYVGFCDRTTPQATKAYELLHKRIKKGATSHLG